MFLMKLLCPFNLIRMFLQLLCERCLAVFNLHEASHYLFASQIAFKSMYDHFFGFSNILLPLTNSIIVAFFLKAHVSSLVTGCGKDWCLMCELEQHVIMLREIGGPLSPSRILLHMRSVIGDGSQEDAHEFLRSAKFAC